jgi:hypothetical protein
VNLQLRAYDGLDDSPGETALVALENGIFSARLGTGQSVSGAFCPALFDGTNRHLQVHVNGERLRPLSAASEASADAPYPGSASSEASAP